MKDAAAKEGGFIRCLKNTNEASEALHHPSEGREIMTDLRKAARGRECQVRFPGICNHDPETTVLAHIRRGGVAGMGMKPPDLVGVWACSACHDVIDGRRKNLPRPPMNLDGMILDALCRTLAQLSKEGLVR